MEKERKLPRMEGRGRKGHGCEREVVGARGTDLARACVAREKNEGSEVEGWAREAVGCEKAEGQRDEREAKRGGGGHKPVRSAKGEPSEAK